MSLIYINPYTFAAPTSGIITDGLQLYLDAGNASSYPSSGTTWTDLSGNGRNGTLTPTVGGPGFDSANGGSITFDGSNDYVQCSGSFTVTASTWIVWMNRGGIDGYDGILFSRSTKTIGINFLSGGPLSYTYEGTSPGPGYNWNSNLIPPGAAWCMVAFAFTATGVTAYVYQTSSPTTASNNYTHPSILIDNIKVGYDVATRYYQGKIAQALIYNRALSQAELTANFNVDKARYGL
jgi:hypothetical protein